ncbi:hypothetical protein PX52LOC_00419 [Limnoglobus roseus]|uniref:YfhO family protein n=2 Tax=Limnoglobus roseus TaxID=2598579 RepID=A0A5C1A388_9BACT|nr:hypothetical protein PX52LOC_00419 [Limnoglobus roseus]
MRIVLHVVAALAGAYMVFAPTIDRGFAVVQTDPGDTALNHYLLEHTWRWASDSTYRHALWSPPFYHPQPMVLAYSENLFGVAPVFWLLRLGLSSAVAFQVWMMVLSVLNYVAMVLVLRLLPVRHGERLPVVMVALGGFLWAYGLPQHVIIDHPQLIGRFWMPPAAYFAWRFAVAPRGRWLGLALLATYLQVLTCINSGWLLTLGLGVYIPVMVWANGTWPDVRAFLRHRWKTVAGCGGLWGAAVLSLVAPYLVANVGQHRDYGECIQFLPSFSSLLAGPEGSWWYTALFHVRDYVGSETRFFSGVGFYALLVAAVWFVRAHRHDVKIQSAQRFVTAGAISAVVLFLATVDFGEGISLWWFLRLLPGGLAIRAVGRVEMIFHLFLIPAALIGFTLWVQNRWPEGRVRQAVLALAAAVVVFEQTGYESIFYKRGDVYGKAERVAGLVAGTDAFYLAPLPSDNPLYPSVIAMWAGLSADVPTVNGYSGRLPPGYPELQQLTDEEVIVWLGPNFHGKVRIVDLDAEPWDVRDYVLP